jgi:hypothetical protein
VFHDVNQCSCKVPGGLRVGPMKTYGVHGIETIWSTLGLSGQK